MKVTIKQLHNEQEEAYIFCLKELVREHNPFTFLTLNDDQEDHVKEWIHKHSVHALNKHVLPHMTYWVLLDNQPIGIATLKKELSQALYADSGHIGICIMQNFRKQGYASLALQALIQEAHTQYHMEDILLCCEYNNDASRKLCERVGGIIKHEDSFVHYWISQHIQSIQDL
ncbi:GNAT family N-acetyltransferase [Amedibacillus sp. YH-ame6]